jgi:hypothetical protein
VGGSVVVVVVVGGSVVVVVVGGSVVVVVVGGSVVVVETAAPPPQAVARRTSARITFAVRMARP